MKKHLFLLLATCLMAFGASSYKNIDDTCPEPYNVHVTAQASGSISFDWDDCGCSSTSFKVKYVRKADGYTSPEYSTGSSNFTFSSLQAGDYIFYFGTDCGGETSGFIGADDLIVN
ncbi:MAG: hypothetical protein IPM82_08615 [Saprospiraceae bacterium]|nr:hypothetical protein [Saprospiraceae bacterium]